MAAEGRAVRAKGEIVGVARKRLRGMRNRVGNKRKGFRAMREGYLRDAEWVPRVLGMESEATGRRSVGSGKGYGEAG